MAHIKAQPLRALHRLGGAILLRNRDGRARIADLAGGTVLGGRLAEFAGKSVVVATGSQLTTALALIELEGIARSLTILPLDADPDHFAAIVAGADIDAVVVDRSSPASAAFDLPVGVTCAEAIAAAGRFGAVSAP